MRAWPAPWSDGATIDPRSGCRRDPAGVPVRQRRAMPRSIPAGRPSSGDFDGIALPARANDAIARLHEGCRSCDAIFRGGCTSGSERRASLAARDPRGVRGSSGLHGKAGGGRGIRTPDRGLSPYNGLANRRLQPLGHPSALFERLASRRMRAHDLACGRVGRNPSALALRSPEACPSLAPLRPPIGHSPAARASAAVRGTGSPRNRHMAAHGVREGPRRPPPRPFRHDRQILRACRKKLPGLYDSLSRGGA